MYDWRVCLRIVFSYCVQQKKLGSSIVGRRRCICLSSLRMQVFHGKYADRLLSHIFLWLLYSLTISADMHNVDHTSLTFCRSYHLHDKFQEVEHHSINCYYTLHCICLCWAHTYLPSSSNFHVIWSSDCSSTAELDCVWNVLSDGSYSLWYTDCGYWVSKWCCSISEGGDRHVSKWVLVRMPLI